MMDILRVFTDFPLLYKIFIVILLIAVLIQLVYWLYYSRFLIYKLPKDEQGNKDVPPVSVIVVLNENHMEWINGDMKMLFAQNHPNYEVIAVNDCGGEDVSLALQRLYLENPILRFTSILPDKRYTHTKKVALLVGIKCAKFDNLIFIEPWTKPSSASWLKFMANGFRGGKDIVIGKSVLSSENGNNNGFARSFNLMSLIRSLRADIARHPYKSSEANFGFTKSIFFASKGYNYLQSSYGESDLYLQKIVRKDNYSLVVGPECLMIKKMESSFKEWYGNLKFTTSTFRFYPSGVKLAIFIELFSSALIWIIFFFVVFETVYLFCNKMLLLPIDVKYIVWWSSIVALVLIRQIVMIIVVCMISKKLNEKNIILSFITYDKIRAFFESFLSLSRHFGNIRRIW